MRPSLGLLSLLLALGGLLPTSRLVLAQPPCLGDPCTDPKKTTDTCCGSTQCRPTFDPNKPFECEMLFGQSTNGTNVDNSTNATALPTCAGDPCENPITGLCCEGTACRSSASLSDPYTCQVVRGLNNGTDNNGTTGVGDSLPSCLGDACQNPKAFPDTCCANTQCKPTLDLNVPFQCEYVFGQSLNGTNDNTTMTTTTTTGTTSTSGTSLPTANAVWYVILLLVGAVMSTVV